MALPDLIEIVPLSRPVCAEITVPGSKSITNRALILAALAQGRVILKGALWSEDTQVMTGALQKLGFEIKVEDDPAEFCNRVITVIGQGGEIPKAGTAEAPLDLFVGNAGTAARFLAAFVCLGRGVYRLSGVPRMHERPQAALFQALRELGYRVESEKGNDKLPSIIFGGGPGVSAGQSQSNAPAKKCQVSIGESSQFASALLLASRPGGWEIKLMGENLDESPYVVMTSKLLEVFPWSGGVFQIEPDASSGSYFWGAGWLAYGLETSQQAQRTGTWSGSPVSVKNWPESGWQIDADFPDFLPFPSQISREGQLGDSIMTAIVLAAERDTADCRGLLENYEAIRFSDLGRLRVQECERVMALRTELTKCGAKMEETGDTLTVYPSALHGAEIETYDDHRMAMCFAILGLKVPGIKLKNPACVKKTFPNFFQKLAQPPPGGLGAVIWEIKNGERTRKLSGDDLFAD
jgi:3-phosphoshikimate 1-carboxyvinyltransferase